MRSSSIRRCRLWLEELESRHLLSGYQPTAQEQLFLEQLNDARANPAAYGATIGVDLSAVAPSQPLAFNTQLIQAARDHSQDMNDQAYFDHNTPQGVDPGQRMTNAGFTWTSWGESIAAGYPTVAQALQGLIIDSGVPDLGHRVQLLAMTPTFQAMNQVGIGIVLNGSGPYSNYYTIDSATGTNTQPFITGVVFNDLNGNGKYDIGEGLGGVTITVAGAGSVSSFTSGGYSFQVAPGTYTVTASGGALGSPVARTITVGTANVRLNFNPAPGSTPPASFNYSMVGDFNGDGKKDLIGFDPTTGNWWIKLSTGSGFSAPQLWDQWAPGATWVDIHTADFNGDGKTDIVGRVSQTGQWWVGMDTGTTFVNSLWATWSPSVTWVDVHVGDFNGDGKADLAGRVQSTGQWWVGVSTGSSFATSLWTTWSAAVTWVNVQVGDFNGDGKTDLIGRYQAAGQWWVGLSNGTSFLTSLWTTWSTGVTWVDINVGDFNGDGKSDLIGRVQTSGQWWVALSTGSGFANALWATWSPTAAWVDVQAVDLNGDGKTDLIGRIAGTSAWYAGLSTGGAFTTQLWGIFNDSTWSNTNVADFTGDGKADVEGRMTDTGALAVGVSGPGGLTFAPW